MAKRDHAVVAVITDITPAQAAQISKDIMRSKQKYAPSGRGTIASGQSSSVGGLLQRGQKRIGR